MEPQVGDFANQMQAIAILGGHDGFRGFLGHLLADRVGALGIQAGDIGRIRRRALTFEQRRLDAVHYLKIDHFLLQFSHRVSRKGVTNFCWTVTTRQLGLLGRKTRSHPATTPTVYIVMAGERMNLSIRECIAAQEVDDQSRTKPDPARPQGCRPAAGVAYCDRHPWPVFGVWRFAGRIARREAGATHGRAPHPQVMLPTSPKIPVRKMR